MCVLHGARNWVTAASLLMDTEKHTVELDHSNNISSHYTFPSAKDKVSSPFFPFLLVISSLGGTGNHKGTEVLGLTLKNKTVVGDQMLQEVTVSLGVYSRRKKPVKCWSHKCGLSYFREKLNTAGYSEENFRTEGFTGFVKV